jgi:hypothetical protein
MGSLQAATGRANATTIKAMMVFMIQKRNNQKWLQCHGPKWWNSLGI